MLEDKARKHLLVISGEPRVLAEIKKDLMGSFDISLAASSDIAVSALNTYDVSAVVIDIGEKRETAFSVFGSISNLLAGKCIPTIFLAEISNDNDEAATFAMGAADYTTRRKGNTKALVSRLSLRIAAGELEKRVMTGEIGPAAEPGSVLADKTILVVDDVEINRDIVTCMLSDIETLVIDEASDGREAVEKFKNDPEKYDLILMDLQMPEMDGAEAAIAIRNLDCKNAREVPIIALTADTEEAVTEKCLASGMNDFLEKPVSLEKLFIAAAEHCSGH